MKIILDTNVYLSALIFGGKSATVLQFCTERGLVFSSGWIMSEIEEKMLRKFKIPFEEVAATLVDVAFLVETVEPAGLKPAICRDPDDNNILWLAQFIEADLIITGDKDLLVLNPFGACRIISVSPFIEHFLPSLSTIP